MKWNEIINRFLQMVEKIKSLKPAYRQPGDGSDGTCDCIGLIIGAIRRMDLKWNGIHGSNWAARKEFVELKKINNISDLELGDAVLKAFEVGESGYNLPSRYKRGGSYYNGDLRDYYHAGVVTSVNPVVITHMTSPSVKTLVVRKKSDLGKWGYHGKLTILVKAAGGTVSEPSTSPKQNADTIPTPQSGVTATVVATSGRYVKMRQYPSTSCRTWENVPVGAVVTLDSPGEEWAQISYGRRKNWYMKAEFLKV